MAVAAGGDEEACGVVLSGRLVGRDERVVSGVRNEFVPCA